MYLPDYQTIKFEHQERIDKASRYRAATSPKRTAKQTERTPVTRPVRRQANGWRWVAAIGRRFAL